MEDEMRAFIQSFIVVVACLTYCYFISSKLRKGKVRLFSVFPVVVIFTLIPLLHSSFYMQFHLGPCIGWLASFKLLLFAFGKDDTLSVNPSMSLLNFILLTTLPIKLKQKSENSDGEKPSQITFAINALLWSLFVQMYITFKHHEILQNTYLVHFLYSARMIFGIQVHFMTLAAFARLLSGQELEKQFNHPYLSTSLQDFWGKRWNLMVTSLLKTSVHEPVKSRVTPIIGKKMGLHTAILATYVVSGLMHEVMHYYVGRQWPTWEVFWFFVIHGVCLCTEIEVKKVASRRGWKLSPIISIPLTVGFVIVTGIWLCYAELIQWGADVREVEEYTAFVEYVKNKTW